MLKKNILLLFIYSIYSWWADPGGGGNGGCEEGGQGQETSLGIKFSHKNHNIIQNSVEIDVGFRPITQIYYKAYRQKWE